VVEPADTPIAGIIAAIAVGGLVCYWKRTEVKALALRTAAVAATYVQAEPDPRLAQEPTEMDDDCVVGQRAVKCV
jgi:hypothetical protein